MKVKCDRCKGKGVVMGMGFMDMECPVCQGTGYIEMECAEAPVKTPIPKKEPKTIIEEK